LTFHITLAVEFAKQNGLVESLYNGLMFSFTLITGNAHKLAEFKRLLPTDYPFDHLALDLDEIQSLDSEVIIADKARRAYEIVKKPVVVEDVSAGLDHLNGLPGPFIKFFEMQLGADALYQLAGTETAATITCTIAYYDGQQMLLSKGSVNGSVVPMRVDNGFGFDGVFVPTGQAQTFSQMTPAEKDTISHRSMAIQNLLKQLKEL
jgi:inosine triphosphate pyrophosphatase